MSVETGPAPATATSNIGSRDFWFELLLKHGTAALIAVYLVYSLVSSISGAVTRLETSVGELRRDIQSVRDDMRRAVGSLK